MSDAETPEGILNPFVRTFAIPAASPWDQDRAAKLNASLNSPIPAADVAISTRRLGLWAPNEPGRYSAAYLRRSQVSGEHHIARAIEGREVEFVFRAERLVRARRRQRLTDLALGLVVCIVVVVAVAKSMTARGENSLVLSSVEHSLRANLARQAEQNRESEIGEVLSAAGVQGRSGDDLMSDLAWLARSRRAGVQIDAVSWDAGAITVRSADQTNPIASTDRDVNSIQTADAEVWRVAARPSNAVVPSIARLPSIVSRPPPPAKTQGDTH